MLLKVAVVQPLGLVEPLGLDLLGLVDGGVPGERGHPLAPWDTDRGLLEIELCRLDHRLLGE